MNATSGLQAAIDHKDPLLRYDEIVRCDTSRVLASDQTLLVIAFKVAGRL